MIDYKIPLLIPELPKLEDIQPYLKRIDESHWYSNFGPLNTEFIEKLLAHFKHSIPHYLMTVSSCTLGLELALKTLKLKPGANVLVPAFTFIASATAIVNQGLTPVFADIDPQTWLLTPEIAKHTLTEFDIDAIMPVASLGKPQDPSAWDTFYDETQIPVIVDAAGAFGNQTVGRNCTYVFSMHATKCFGIGEGGFVISPHVDMINNIRILSNFGLGKTLGCRTIYTPGTNAKLSEYHAAVGLAMLDIWQNVKTRRTKLLQHYRTQLQPFAELFTYQKASDQLINSIFAIRLNRKIDLAEIIAELNSHGIQTLRWYHPPLQQHPAFEHYPCAGDLCQVNQLAEQLLGLPFHLRLSQTEIDYIIQSLKNVLQPALT